MPTLAFSWHDVLDGLLPVLLCIVLPLAALVLGALLPPFLYAARRKRKALLFNAAGLIAFLWTASPVLGLALTGWNLYAQVDYTLLMLKAGSLALLLFAAAELAAWAWARRHRP